MLYYCVHNATLASMESGTSSVAGMTLDALKDDADRDTEFQLKGNEAFVGDQGRGGPATAVAQG